MRRKQCEHCQCMFAGHAQQRFCGASCFNAWRKNQPGWREAQRRGGLATQAKNRRELEARAGEIVAGLTPAQAYVRGRNEGYPVGWKVGLRKGYSDGYEKALQDMKRARVA